MQNIPVQPTVIEYQVCAAHDHEILSKEINKALAKGFTVHGPLNLLEETIATDRKKTLYAQAMVKIELRPMNIGGMDSTIMPVSGILKP